MKKIGPEEIRLMLENNEHARICPACGDLLDDLDSYDEPCQACLPQWAKSRLEEVEREAEKARAEVARVTAVLAKFEALLACDRAMLEIDGYYEQIAFRRAWIAAKGKPKWPSEEEWHFDD